MIGSKGVLKLIKDRINGCKYNNLTTMQTSSDCGILEITPSNALVNSFIYINSRNSTALFPIRHLIFLNLNKLLLGEFWPSIMPRRNIYKK